MSFSSSASLDALEGFCMLARLTTGEQCAMIVRQALKHPSIYVFGELLDTPSIQSLQSTEHQQWLDLLRLFAHGSYADYKRASPPLPELSALELQKLKALTAVSLASEAPNKLLSYSTLSQELDLSSVREIETLLIDCFDHGLLAGKLDQQNAAVEISFVMGRDIGPSDLPSMIKTLAAWVAESEDLLLQLQREMHTSKQTVDEKFAQQLGREERIQSVIDALKASHEGSATQTAVLDPALKEAIKVYQQGSRGGEGGAETGGRDNRKRGLRAMFTGGR